VLFAACFVRAVNICIGLNGTVFRRVNMTKSYIFLLLAIMFEVFGTILLPATQNFTKLLPTILVGAFYVLSFYLLTFTLKEIPIHIAYAIWSGLGIFSISVISLIFLKHTMSWQVTFGLFLIIAGVILVNLYHKA